MKGEDHLQPALLDRLLDDEPAVQDSDLPEMQVVSRGRLRDAVLRDLIWLFNTTQSGSDADPRIAPEARLAVEEIDWSIAPEARSSVLGFGLPALSGQTASSISIAGLEARVRQAIHDHEPRIARDTLRVEANVSDEQLDHHNQISFRITGHLWAQPFPIELSLQTKVDLETGRVDVQAVSR